jgi:hypothetical protein
LGDFFKVVFVGSEYPHGHRQEEQEENYKRNERVNLNARDRGHVLFDEL